MFGGGLVELSSTFEASVRLARNRLFRMHENAGVGHLGGNLSSLDALLVLHHLVLTVDDVFILSKGHSAGALYVALWSIGELTDGDLDSFHEDGTRLPGHPPVQGMPGVSFGTGSLGHGLGLATGLALAKKLLGEKGRVYCLTSDGEWQEGSTWEALHFGLGAGLDNLTVMVDMNSWQGFGRVENVAPALDLATRLESLSVLSEVVDGHSHRSILSSLRSEPGFRCVLLKTLKGKGWTGFEDTLQSHYIPPRPAAGSSQ